MPVGRIDRSTPPGFIREFRNPWGLTQHELARALGLGKNRLSDYETGPGAPAWVRYALVGYAAVVLRVPVDALAWLTPDVSGTDADADASKSGGERAR